jgi:hypothetical protein
LYAKTGESSENIRIMKTKHGDPTFCSCKRSKSSAWCRTGAADVANPNSTMAKQLVLKFKFSNREVKYCQKNLILMKPKCFVITEFNGLLHQVRIQNFSLEGESRPEGMYHLCFILKIKAQV